MTNYAVFLDRDGTINEDLGFVRRPKDFVLIEGAAKAMITSKQARNGFLMVAPQAVAAVRRMAPLFSGNSWMMSYSVVRCAGLNPAS